MRLQENDCAPSWSALDYLGYEYNLRDFTNKFVVLYFYPKDNTQACTLQAQDFSALIDEFNMLDCVIIGVSPDSHTSHEKFIKKYNLKHTLLSDTTRQIATSYGAYGEKIMYGKKVLGIIRSTFIINKDGRIIKTYYNIKAKNHVQTVLDDLRNIVANTK